MGNKEVIDYVMNSPGNTNPSVLKGLLGDMAGGNSGGAFKVVITPDENWSIFTADKEFDEILAACNAGNCTILLDEGGGFYDQFAIVNFDTNNIYCDHVGYANVGSGAIPHISIMELSIKSDNTITFKQGGGSLSNG